MRDRFKSMSDLYYTTRGDFALGENGDLKDTKNDIYRSLIQMILDRLMSNQGDWILHPEKGTGLNSIMGRPNTADNAKELKASIQNALLYNGLLRMQEFTVDVVPISKTEVMAVVIIVPPGASQAVFIPLTYDLRTNRVTPRIA
jgi:hypothetical protein